MDFEIEKALIESFFLSSKRDRYLELLNKPKGRAKVRSALAHFRDLDPKATRKIPPNHHAAESIEHLLTGLGAPTTCYLVSANEEWDGKTMNLGEALKLVVGYSYGTLISCKPGVLGYFEGEDPGERFILMKRPSI